ncbi:Ltp family lipoprotein [Bifidobacterium sp. ESL0728]|uniref:Ltp family lipoprotein n=1 Tax=Bifidobacterium sp. ESL0728 TaxID=2983220 RepID=UPI0023F8E513|nr:Ltp family lipoprotein [Bifidobacterium sp. ESL0728]WEV58466.1 Ltp family lipoprotein [Bifidobacterium sp. ESL0728]
MPDSPQSSNGQKKIEDNIQGSPSNNPINASRGNGFAQAEGATGGTPDSPADNANMSMARNPFPVVNGGVHSPNAQYNGRPGRNKPEHLSAGGVTALVLGIVGTVLSFIPIVNNVAAVLGVIGVVFGVIGLFGVFRGKKRGKALTIAGVVLSIVAIVITLGMQSSASKAFDSASKSVPSSTSQQQSPQQKKANVPMEYTNALASAKTYSDTMHMSKQGIYDQLTSEAGDKFSAQAAQYAVDNLKADYNANALAAAKSYEKNMHMSPEAIREQLTASAGDKFTPQEADYAIQHLND